MATDATETQHDMCLEVTKSKGPERRRQGKFQPFRRLFGKKKKREAKAGFDGAELKASFSTGEVCNGVVSDDEEASQLLREVNPVGARALSHDSIFIPEETTEEDTAAVEHTMSQENVSDKVRNLQRQIAQSIKFGQKLPSMRRSEGDECSTDEEEVPRSPMKVQVQAQVQAQAQVEAEPSKLEPKPQAAQPAALLSGSPPAKSPRSRRVLPPTGTIESINLDAVPQSGPRLDNAAAKHKLSVKPKNQRVSRKHRRFTQDLQDVSIPGVLEEDSDAPCFSADAQRRASAEEPLQLSESFRRRQHEEEVRRRREEEERKRAEEQRLRELEEERKRREEEERLQREEEEKRAREELLRQQREEERRRAEEERKKLEEEEKRKREEEEEARRQQELLEKRLREEEEARKRKEQEDRRKQEEEEEKKRQAAEERARKEREEEQRWREMEERQKPFSFKVSSGEKQILFQKVNLTPVTPGSPHQGTTVEDHKDSTKAASSEVTDSNLATSTYIPHTAILVTGAQLCGPAVNLDQIKDTACKSLLGLEEKKKTPGTPTKTKTSPDRKSGKTKSLNEASLCTEQSDILAEWASIRSKIFKGVEDGNYDPEVTKCQPPLEEQPAFSHTHLRKTMSASAKFSITPAKKKFGDSNRNSEVFGAEDVGEISAQYDPPVSPAPKPKSKSVRIMERTSDECVFAKDLPSFLVPGAKPEPGLLKNRALSETYERKEDLEEDLDQDGEDSPSPFGIKLRRTNYSLRFHSEQSTEKRKKRYSAGDSFDGVPSPLTPIEPDLNVSPVFSDRVSPASPPREGAVSKYFHSPAVSRAKPAKSPSPIPPSESEKVVSKPPVYRRPATSPKPSGSVPTPPPSPLPKLHHGTSSGGHREAAVEPVSSHDQTRREETQRSSQGNAQGEEEPKEKKSFFPSINIPWREKADRKTELVKKEKPSLQSRHSLDSAKVQEKEAGPLWITLALQKQKGFREQQQSREERRSQREAKLAEKQSRDSLTLLSPTDSRGSGSSSPSSKPQTPEEPKRPDSLLGRFERREQLKKANTLPSSVTVEIADSTPSPPAVKDVSKRFPSSDSPQVSTEPAWLALAKRKAKAWSDCPQIIK